MKGCEFYDDGAATQLYGVIINNVAVTNADWIDNWISGVTGPIQLISSGSITGTLINNRGYNPVGVSSVTPGASPWTYTNGNSPSTLMLGGFVGITSVTIGGASVPVNSSTGGNFPLAPGQVAVVTYGTAGTASVAVQ
jgi:hypothetical protein